MKNMRMKNFKFFHGCRGTSSGVVWISSGVVWTPYIPDAVISVERTVSDPNTWTSMITSMYETRTVNRNYYGTLDHITNFDR